MSEVPSEAELKERAVGPRVTEEALKGNIANVEYYIHPGSQLTICIITLNNGYTVTGESACADPANFQKDVGEKFARQAAEKKIWPLMGYALKQELYLGTVGTTFLERLEFELKELTDKLNKLNAFIGGNVHFKDLHADQQNLLIRQREVMNTYAAILNERIIANRPAKPEETISE